MSALLKNLSKNSFLVFGRAGMDLFADPVGTRSTKADLFRSGLGGSAANIAVGIVKFGGTADLMTSVSDDAVGWFCLNQLQGYGVGTDYVRKVGGEFRTQIAVYESVVEDFQNVLYRNAAADFQVTKSDVLRADYARYGAFVTTGTAFAAEPSRSSAFTAIDTAKAAGLSIVFDLDYRPYSWTSPEEASKVLSRAADLSDVIVGNDEEFDFMAGGKGLGLSKAEAIAGPNRLIVFKMGGDGAITFADGNRLRTGVFRVDPVKPNGAGDSFMAGLLAGLAEGRDLEDSILRGSAAAAIVVSKPGCAAALPDAATLDTFLADHPGPT